MSRTRPAPRMGHPTGLAEWFYLMPLDLTSFAIRWQQTQLTERPGLRKAITGKPRVIVTPEVAKPSPERCA